MPVVPDTAAENVPVVPDTAPEEFKEVTVVSPAPNVPVVNKFSLLKLILPVELVINPEDIDIVLIFNCVLIVTVFGRLKVKVSGELTTALI